MSLTHAAFAIAGLIAAAGPVVIHLLNRHRYRTLEWGAMAFLRKAVKRSRRSIRLRDLLLLALRTAALLLFGFALARPLLTEAGLGSARIALIAIALLAAFGGAIAAALAGDRKRRTAGVAVSLTGVLAMLGLIVTSGGQWSNERAAASNREPVHAIYVVDNSRSMAARTLDGTLLDFAKQRASASFGSLPRGSRISVMPLCGPEQSYSLDGYVNVDDARSSLDRITITDRSGSALRMLSLAAEAAQRLPELPAKRIVFLGDQQATGWPHNSLADAVRNAGGPLQVVSLSSPGDEETASGPANIWIESFSVQDGLAEANQPATFLATIRCAGREPVENVELVLTQNGHPAASETIDLRPGQSREVALTASLDEQTATATPSFVPVTLALHVAEPAANELERDDFRSLAVPVASAIPVVFIDQYGHDENLDAGRMGETYRLRRLLAPRPLEGVYDPLVTVRQTTMPQLAAPLLEDARLVVVAGVERPTADGVRLLRQYVEQGGPLVISAGANFDPAAWTATAWLDGRGILPAPLAEAAVGLRPTQATSVSQIAPFRLDGGSLGNPLFQIPGESASALADLWSQPYFFQAVEADVSETTVARAVASETERIAAERAALADESSDSTDLAPDWLRWSNARRTAGGDNPDVAGSMSPRQRAAETAPRVLARFDRRGSSGAGVPYLIERRLGYGRVLMLAAGLSSDWDTLAQTNAIVLLDRITRSLLEDTLPGRNFTAGDDISIPIDRRPDVMFHLSRQDGESTPLAAEATDAGYVLRVGDTSVAGLYTIAAERSDEGGSPIERFTLAVNGPVEESDLTPIDDERFDRLIGDAEASWVGAGDELNVTGGPARAGDLWKWLIGGVLCCLLAEMAVAARWRSSAGEGRR